MLAEGKSPLIKFFLFYLNGTQRKEKGENKWLTQNNITIPTNVCLCILRLLEVQVILRQNVNTLDLILLSL